MLADYLYQLQSRFPPLLHHESVGYLELVVGFPSICSWGAFVALLIHPSFSDMGLFVSLLIGRSISSWRVVVALLIGPSISS